MGVHSSSQWGFNKTSLFLLSRIRDFENTLPQTNIEKPELLRHLNKFWEKKYFGISEYLVSFHSYLSLCVLSVGFLI